MTHRWIKSTLGHGETMCEFCSITNREAAVLGVLNTCDKAPVEKMHPNEIAEIFGDFMPLEVVAVIKTWSGSVDGLRVELRRIAAKDNELQRIVSNKAVLTGVYCCACGAETPCAWTDLNLGKFFKCPKCGEIRVHVYPKHGGSAWITVDPEQAKLYDLLGHRYEARQREEEAEAQHG